MSEDDRRKTAGWGRRDDDDRWIKFQEQLMNLVTAQRTTQQETTRLELGLTKAQDHLDDLDDHLRGVVGNESMDMRIAVLERSSSENNTLLRKVDKKLDALKDQSDALQIDVSTIKLHRSVSKEYESTKFERFKEWLRFWGPILIASIALVVPLVKVYLDYRATVYANDTREDDRLRKQIEQDKRSKHAKEVQKKLKALENAQLQNP